MNQGSNQEISFTLTATHIRSRLVQLLELSFIDHMMAMFWGPGIFHRELHTWIQSILCITSLPNGLGFRSFVVNPFFLTLPGRSLHYRIISWCG